ncbi:MAG: hypothetical protein WA970_15690 [Gammaproteobacteria bacterium]
MLAEFAQRDLEVFAVFAHQAALGIETDEYTSGRSETVAKLGNEDRAFLNRSTSLPRSFQ